MKFFLRFLRVLAYPSQEWVNVTDERGLMRPVLHVALLLFASFVSRVVTLLLTEEQLRGAGTTAQSISMLLLGSAVLVFGCAAISVVVNGFAAVFGAKSDLRSAFRLVAYSSTPYFIGGIVYPLHGLRLVGLLFTFYSVVLFWHGLVPVMSCPPQNRTAYTIVIGIITVTLFILGLLSIALLTI